MLRHEEPKDVHAGIQIILRVAEALEAIFVGEDNLSRQIDLEDGLRQEISELLESPFALLQKTSATLAVSDILPYCDGQRLFLVRASDHRV